MLEQHYFIIEAYDDKELVALTGCWIATKFYSGKYLEVDNFIVDRNHRGQSIGKQIMDYVLAEAKKLRCDSIVLNGYINNEAAHRFYNQYGFETLAKHRILRLSKI